MGVTLAPKPSPSHAPSTQCGMITSGKQRITETHVDARMPVARMRALPLVLGASLELAL